MSLKDQVALITGAGQNLGTECVRQLVTEGANLAIHYNSPRCKDLTLRFRDEVMKACGGIKVSIHGGDLGTGHAVEQLFSEVLAEHKRVDLVVNTLGTVLRKPSNGTSATEYDKMFAYAVFVDEQRRRTVDQFHAESIRRQKSS